MVPCHSCHIYGAWRSRGGEGGLKTSYRHWRIKLFYVQKCQTEINRFKVFDDE